MQITATANNPGDAPLTFTWNASAGQIIGSGASVKFDTVGLGSGSYTVTGHVSDANGGAADCSVNVNLQAPTPLEMRLALHSIYFPTARPDAQNPDGGLLPSQQQTLIALASDFETYRETNPTAHLILEGHADPRGSVEFNQALSERRVDLTKRFLVGRGVPPEDIETKALGVTENLTDAQVQEAVSTIRS